MNIMSISYKFTKFEVKEIGKRSEQKYHSFSGSPTSKLKLHSTEEQKSRKKQFRFRQKKYDA